MNLDDYGPLLSAEAFLEIDFGERIKAELADGLVTPLVRGPMKRVRVAGNLLALVHGAVRGTDMQTFGSMLMVKAGSRSVRFPDVAVYAKTTRPIASQGDRDLMIDPVLAAHVRKMSNAEIGQLVGEYQALPSVRAIVLIDHEAEVVRHWQRTGTGAWLDEQTGQGGDVVIPSLDLLLPHAEIFARD
jgi:Uma2 family endonuclease